MEATWLTVLCTTWVLASEVPAVPVEPVVPAESVVPAEPVLDPAESVLDPDRTEWSVFPILAGNTDMGILLGGQVFLAKFKKGVSPYALRTHTQVAVSFKGGPDGIESPVHMDFAKFDIPGLLNGKLRLWTAVFYDQSNNSGYFGVGNATILDVASTDPAVGHVVPLTLRRNQYQIKVPRFRLTGQFLVAKNLYVVVGLRFQYVLPYAFSGSRLYEDRNSIKGLYDHAALQFGLGVIHDTRDHETSPTRGWFVEADLRGAPGLGNDLNFGGLFLDGRFFVPVVRDGLLVFATRIVGDFLFGNAPYYEMGWVGTFDPIEFPGGFKGLPGIPQGRFHGKIKVGTIAELRSMFYRFSIFGLGLRLGALVFADVGRVWADYAYDPKRDGSGAGLKYGVGGGLRLQWGETVMIRADVAWSPWVDDAGGTPVGIYLDANHLF